MRFDFARFIKTRNSKQWILGLTAVLGFYSSTAQTSLKDVTSETTSITSVTNGANLVDNTKSTYATIDNGSYCRIDLGTAKVIKGYSLTNHPTNSTYNPTNWTIEGSNNATSGFVVLDTRTATVWEKQGSRKLFALNNTNAYRYYRINNTASSRNMRIAELELFDNFSISGSVFQDYNLNNSKESTEPAVVGAKVWIKSLSAATPAATTLTGLNGSYSFGAAVLDGLEIFSVTAQPLGNLQPRTEPMPQSGLSFPSLAADANFIFSNIQSEQYAQTGVINFGFLPPTTTMYDAGILNPNLVTNANNGTFGTTDASGDAYVLNHPNTKYFSLTATHPELYSDVTGYRTGSNYTYQNGDYGTNGFLWDAGKYVVTDFLGTNYLEAAGTDMGLKGILNNMNFGWRVTTGATTGAWNDRFLAVNGSNLVDSSLNAILFADTVRLTSGNTYSMGFYGKSANKWQQGTAYAKPTTIKYFVKRISTNDTAALGTIAVQSTGSDAMDSINFGWNKAFTDFTAKFDGDYAIYYLVTSSDESGNDAYFDNFFVRKSSYKISGKIYNDANGLTNNLVDGALIGKLTADALYAYLLDPADNRILGKAMVNADGTYTLFAPEYALYNVAVSTKELTNGTVYSETNLGDWSFTGSNLGMNNAKGLGISILSKLLVSPLDLLSDITNVNFGFQRLPQSYDRSKNITGAPVLGVALNLGDLPLQGSDPEDNNSIKSDWNNRALIITELPTNGFILKYNGVVVTAGDSVFNYNPALLTVTPGPGTPAGTLQTNFKYAAIDAAKQADPSPATYSIAFTQPLPIDLLSFDALAKSDCTVALSWTSGVEDNFNKFIIERSSTGRDFKAIQEVFAQGAQSQYVFTDHSAGSGKQFYRLKLVDNDNSYAYSKVLSLVLNCAAEIKVYPTITAGMVTVEGVQRGDLLKVIDASGRVIMEQYATVQTGQLNLKSFSAGNYFITISHNEETQVFKVVKL
ncbi:hypothetical protein DBR32_06925 [Taibaiella sp. KBW10]|uniref:T9SS type A sorting domain-containing protein n=1 Tax=Taibaiella sp. KBW10 TaxID=2153357 RepID=UPI000F5995D3|nr:T9SS type A sorting domain-containing protein [Taibaiella sp. KBW10]RQO31674.1 hypothetical protein DBR32_06925 [Taibaiella sp. KBW10]